MTLRHNWGSLSLLCRIISSFNSWIVFGLLLYTITFKKPQRKKSSGVKITWSWRPITSQRLEVTRPLNFSAKRAIDSLAVWQEAPSCCNHISSRSICSISGHKTSVNRSRYRTLLMITAWPTSLSKKYSLMTPPVYKPYQTVTLCACIGFSSITGGFSFPQLWKFCLITNALRGKCASLQKMISFVK